MADIGLAAFSIFFMGSPSFLGHQQALAEGHGPSNCETLFGMSAIPSDNYIRLMLDGASPAAFDGLFVKAIEAAGPLTPFQCLDGRVQIALDGSEQLFGKIKSAVFDTAARRWRHRILPRLPGCQHGRTGHKQVLPLPPEFIAPQNGAGSRTSSAMPRKRWRPGTAPTSLTSGLSISATICLPASRTCRHPIRRQLHPHLQASFA